MRHTLAFERPAHTLAQAPPPSLPEICVSGRSNVGKSSMINCLAGAKKLAKVSQTPGKTRALNYFLADEKCYLVDLPGYGYAKTSHKERAQFGRLVEDYLTRRTTLAGLIQLIDARHGPVGGDFEMLEWLASWEGRVLYVFTKADKLSASQRSTVLKHYNKEFGVENMIMFSASTGVGRESVWQWIHEVVSRS